MLATCRELGIGFVPYSPWAAASSPAPSAAPKRSATMTGAAPSRASSLTPSRPICPWWRPSRDGRATRASRPAQLALAWVLHQGDFIVPIPGVRKVRHLEDNAAAADIKLSADELAKIGDALTPDRVAGNRYTDEGLALVNG